MAAYLVGVELAGRNLRRERVFRDRFDQLDSCSDAEVFKKYRFSREGVMEVIDLIGEELEHPSKRNCALPSSLQLGVQVLIALNFFGPAYASPQCMVCMHPVFLGAYTMLQKHCVDKNTTRVKLSKLKVNMGNEGLSL